MDEQDTTCDESSLNYSAYDKLSVAEFKHLVKLILLESNGKLPNKEGWKQLITGLNKVESDAVNQATIARSDSGLSMVSDFSLTTISTNPTGTSEDINTYGSQSGTYADTGDTFVDHLPDSNESKFGQLSYDNVASEWISIPIEQSTASAGTVKNVNIEETYSITQVQHSGLEDCVITSNVKSSNWE